MKKQYIKDSNLAPNLGLGKILLLVLAVREFNLPSWTYGVVGSLAFLYIFVALYRIFTEEGVDVVEKG